MLQALCQLAQKHLAGLKSQSTLWTIFVNTGSSHSLVAAPFYGQSYIFQRHWRCFCVYGWRCILPALEKGTIDAAEWCCPKPDSIFGFRKKFSPELNITICKGLHQVVQ